MVPTTATMNTETATRRFGALGTAGSFAAISALFGGPIVGGVLMMERAIGFGAATTRILLPTGSACLCC
jgi:hypothetical protein